MTLQQYNYHNTQKEYHPGLADKYEWWCYAQSYVRPKIHIISVKLRNMISPQASLKRSTSPYSTASPLMHDTLAVIVNVQLLLTLITRALLAIVPHTCIILVWIVIILIIPLPISESYPVAATKSIALVIKKLNLLSYTFATCKKIGIRMSHKLLMILFDSSSTKILIHQSMLPQNCQFKTNVTCFSFQTLGRKNINKSIHA